MQTGHESSTTTRGGQVSSENQTVHELLRVATIIYIERDAVIEDDGSRREKR